MIGSLRLLWQTSLLPAWDLDCGSGAGIGRLAIVESRGPTFARVLTGRAVIQTTQTLVESLQNVRAQRGRKCSDSLPLETWQAARQNFGTSPANKLHASFRQLTPWLLNPTHNTVFPYLYSSRMECLSSHLFGNPWSFTGVGSTSLQRISYSLNPLSQVVINESLSIIYLVFFSPFSLTFYANYCYSCSCIS